MSKEKHSFEVGLKNYPKLGDCKFYSSFGWREGGGGIFGLDKNRTIIRENISCLVKLMLCIYTALGVYQFYTDFPQNFYINAFRISLYQVVLDSSTFTSIPYS
jgi:hypothetical protein